MFYFPNFTNLSTIFFYKFGYTSQCLRIRFFPNCYFQLFINQQYQGCFKSEEPFMKRVYFSDVAVFLNYFLFLVFVYLTVFGRVLGSDKGFKTRIQRKIFFSSKFLYHKFCIQGTEFFQVNLKFNISKYHNYV